MQRRNSDSTQNVFGEDNESKSDDSGASLESEEPAVIRAADQASRPVSRPLSTSSARSTSGIIKAIRSRIQAIRSGELLSIMFIR